MDVSKEKTTSYPENSLMLHSYLSKEEFVRKYKKLYCYKSKAQEFYIFLLTELEKELHKDDIIGFQKLSNVIDWMSDLESEETLRDFYVNADNPIRSTNLVILASKHNKVNILKYLFDQDSRVLNRLCIGSGRTYISPEDEDEASHNAFYYAIGSENVQLLKTLINKWSDEKLDGILSKAYEELKLKNVLLSDEMEAFVENKLINLRFFSSGQDPNPMDDLDKTRERLELLLQSIGLLKTDYSNTEEVDERFLFVAKFIARNIHILKQRLRSTYDRLPWEEIEFCLVIFISSQTKIQELNLFYRATLNKKKVINYLDSFAYELRDKDAIMEGDKLHCLPRGQKREKIIEKIIGDYPQFAQLYIDYQHIRDIYSLRKINDNISLALSVDVREKQGQLVITRVLQIIGEHLKNTLDSAKLSYTTGELLILLLPNNTRKIILHSRDAISHTDSLSKIIEIEKNSDPKCFINIQNDIKKVGDVITNILYKSKIEVIREFLKKIVNEENSDEIIVSEILDKKELLNYVIDENKIIQNFKMLEHEKLKELTKELSNIVADKTVYETELFRKINSIVNAAETQSKNMEVYMNGFTYIQMVISGALQAIVPRHIKQIRSHAKATLQSLTASIELRDLKTILRLSREISHSVRSRIQRETFDNVERLVSEIICIVKYEIDDIKWIEKFSEKLNEKPKELRVKKQRTRKQENNSRNVKEEKKYYNEQLSELKIILSEKPLFHKRDKKLLTVVHMLVLDIMSILGDSKDCLQNNLLFLDDNAPILHGRCLRNYLAHDNILVDVLSSDPSMAVILNANKFTEEDIMKSGQRIGKLVSDDPAKVSAKYQKDLQTITNQQNMFVAFEEGNLESLKVCLEKGADIKARSTITSWTTVHFAAKGSSLEVIKFIPDQSLNLNAKDNNGQIPLHIAAAHGRPSVVEFLVNKARPCNVDCLDDSGKTPLHLAAENGHTDAVEVLLKYNANTDIQDLSALTPTHYATINNHINVVKILLKKDVNAFSNEGAGGSTHLFQAAQCGHLELLNFLLLENKTDVNARTDSNLTPLHRATINGHLEIVDALILNGASVNAQDVMGLTPLHCVTINGHEEIANLLLTNGASVNSLSKNQFSPLHYAALEGHQDIVKLLLQHNADVNSSNNDFTPLHCAVQNNSVEIVTILLKYGADGTPLTYAAELGRKEVAALLIEFGAKVNSTALHAAIQNGHKDVVDLLIMNNADVNARNSQGATPLYTAAVNGSKAIIDVLIKNKAEVNTRCLNDATPLHAAVMNGHLSAVDILISNEANINATVTIGYTALHLAVLYRQKEIVNLLIQNNAQVNVEATGNRHTPLYVAARAGHTEIVEALIISGANVRVEDIQGWTVESFVGSTDIIEMLLKNKAHVNCKDYDHFTPLHLAAEIGHKKLVNSLIAKGADVNAPSIYNITPLWLAARKGYGEVVEILIARGAKVEAKNYEDVTPLHAATLGGHSRVVKVLLENEGNINFKDSENMTLLQVATSLSHLAVVKTLMQNKKANSDIRGDNDFTLLHYASQISNLELIKYLVDEGYDINARTCHGDTAMHVAGRNGYKAAIEFFVSKAISVNQLGADNETLLHCTAKKGDLEITKYLLKQCADVNAENINGLTPVDVAAMGGYTAVVEVLLQHNALLNKKAVIELLEPTQKLFEAVKRNSSSEVNSYIKAGAFVNAKSAEGITPLHSAALHGYNGVVDVLLQNNANPNKGDHIGLTPLHYAAKFSHLKVVQALLSYHAVYNAVSDDGKTPSDLSANESITSLLNLVDRSFEDITNDNSKVISDLYEIKDTGTVKAVMCAHNRESATLVVAAMQSNFSQVEQLKEILQGDVSAKIKEALKFSDLTQYDEALSIFKSVLEKRKEVLGSDNPGTLDIQKYIVDVLIKQVDYREALNLSEEIFQKQKTILGLNNEYTLNTRSTIARVLFYQGKDEEALSIFQEVYRKQNEVIGPNHTDTLDTQIYMARILNNQGKYEEALSISRLVLEKCNNDQICTLAQKNIANVLHKQGNPEEALQIYKEIWEKEKLVLGINHLTTALTLNRIAGLLFKQNKLRESLKIHQEFLNNWKNNLGPNHPHIFDTQCTIGFTFICQQKWISALKAYTECFDQIKAFDGPSDIKVMEILKDCERIKMMFFLRGSEPSEILRQLQASINIAASNGDLSAIRHLLKDESDANYKDTHGITPLHCAVSNGHMDMVNILLQYGADVTEVSNNGNTLLHTAVSKDYKEITKSLLKRGAIYNITNTEGKTPLDLCRDQDIINFLKLVEELFEDAKNGNPEINSKLTAVTPDEFQALIHVRNDQQYTLLQILIANKHKNVAHKLEKILQDSSAPDINVESVVISGSIVGGGKEDLVYSEILND